MRIVNRNINPTMVELIIGIAFYSLIGGVILAAIYLLGIPIEGFFRDSIFNVFLGFFVGTGYSVFMIVHMARMIEDSLDRDEKSATTKAWMAYGIRMAILVVIMVIMIFVHIGNVFMMLIGLLGLKLSAYIQPVTHKLTEKYKKGR